jgi:hypothetical protein
MFSETNPNMPHDRIPRPWEGFDRTDFVFIAGAALAFIGVALVFVPAALFAVGVLLMFVAWRAAK